MASKRVREAKARLADVRAKIAAIDAEKEAKEAARKPLLAALAKATKRGKPAIAYAANEYRLLEHGPMALSAGYYGETKGKTERQIRDGLLDGSVSISLGSGPSSKLSGLAKRLRTVDKAAWNRIRRARQKRDRAALALSRANTLLLDALRETYAVGAKATPEELAKQLARRFALLEKTQDGSYGYSQEAYNRSRLADYDLPNAQKHLEAAKSGAECDCSTCKAERADAESKRKVAEYVAKLPKVIRPCPEHGKRRMATERGPGSVPGIGYREDMPILYCPVGNHRLVDGKQLEQDERARKRKPRVAAA